MTEQLRHRPSEQAAVDRGTIVGGRFELVERHRNEGSATLWLARDQRSQKRVAVRIFVPGAVPPKAIDSLRDKCAAAAKLRHENITRLFGVGKTKDGLPFVAQAWVDGAPLSEFLGKRAETGEPLSLRGAYNVVAHVCQALEYAHERLCHGTMRPSAVWVTSSGRVKIVDFGIGLALIQAAGPNVFGPIDHACLAPEVKAGELPTERSDIFGVGAVLYELLTGKSPAHGFVPPSQVHPEATSAVDDIVMRCLAPSPDDRFANPRDVRDAMQPLLEQVNSIPPDTDLGMTQEVDLGSVLPPAGVGSMLAPAIGALPALPAAPAPGSGNDSALSNAIEELTDDDAPHWMISKDGLDHGPFRGRELIDFITEGKFQGDDLAINMDTRESKPVREWSTLGLIVTQHERDQLEREEAARRDNVGALESRSRIAKTVTAVAVLGALLLGAAFFVSTRQESKAASVQKAQLEDLYKLGEIKVRGETGILPVSSKRGEERRTGGARPTRGGGGDGAGSFEAAMNQAVEMNVNSGGGADGDESMLSGEQISQTMSRLHGRFSKECVVAELKRGGSIREVRVDLAIASSGSVLGASVRDGGPEFRACVSGLVRTIKFPSFGASRMGARYRFFVN